MKEKKKFDCVQMKWHIQKKIEKKYAGISDKEKYERIYEEIKNNPLLSKFAVIFKNETGYPA
ncbi:MAG: hypothetical protein A2X61_07535 [Ignavibacteria bacterium GWB2_35_12]|nr:MAG: hypothetical protein A2X63_12835 [Ignavibacteria bacterium GWA2_35_8]OGU39178.1 MAG: hypothetical protein A2X61_07535 [Ignavibacteria bacterium GWB2_35_12]OGU89206.1 MAG: hypothetical protein A2220_00925 [Ignavibacteria bacterium RIFOXYA2_FULL_35_10]OGV21044.1 MAG: hypothetical protein A2475_00825 [Ignavibacteria bacterium RIFOXYC2_FULL_35_21]